ncbi:hypothetical protein Tco_1090233 [Tanacetum coccineum]|uniref:Uncharacterized protein n=1 Tax=Tanacetum coccineum TaxID=301880 RepID=A0ABQ5I3R5_9ASTR
MGNTDEPPVVKADPKDWFKKSERPPTPDPEWNEGKTVDNKPTRKWLSDLAKAETSSKTLDNLISTPIDFSTYKSYVELEYNMEECYRALTDQLDWNNPKGDRYPFDMSKPLPLSPIKVAYDKHALLVTSHWGPKRQRFYGYASKRVCKHDVYSTNRILAVTNVKVNVWYGYGHLEEIKVRRSDQQLLFNLKGEDIVHLAATLHMFTRRIVIPKRVEDLQLGVESYQKKLNISKPRTREEDLSRKAPYTTLSDPQGVIYEDKLNRKRLMRSDELYKFSDSTLQSVRDTLHDMATNLRMRYNKAMPKRRWSHLDKTRSTSW